MFLAFFSVVFFSAKVSTLITDVKICFLLKQNLFQCCLLEKVFNSFFPTYLLVIIEFFDTLFFVKFLAFYNLGLLCIIYQFVKVVVEVDKHHKLSNQSYF